MEVTPGKIIGGATAVIVLAGMVLWGVPYYIGAQVRSAVSTELEAAGVTDGNAASAANTAAISAISGTLTSMENRMIARDEFVMNYFKEQADRAAAAADGN